MNVLRQTARPGRALGVIPVRKRLKKSIPYFILIALPLIILLVFKYYPMLGAQIALKDYKVRLGIWDSPWVGLKHFATFFQSTKALTIVLNTLYISVYYLIASFPLPILLAVCLNESRWSKFKKATQMITYMPYFISTVVLVSMILQFTDATNGILNQMLNALGLESVNLMGEISYFRSVYVWTGVWQSTGYASIIYLAALSSVPTELYDAARVDGANKFRRVFSIDLPCIAPTIITLFILNTGSILSVGFEKIYLMQNSINTPVSEVISTYVYKVGLINANFSFSTAVGLMNSIVNLTLLLIVNAISGKISDIRVV